MPNDLNANNLVGLLGPFTPRNALSDTRTANQNALLSLLAAPPNFGEQFRQAAAPIMNRPIGPEPMDYSGSGLPQPADMRPSLSSLLNMGIEAVPGVGDYFAVQDFNKANQEGDRLGAWLSGMSLIPGIGEAGALAAKAAPWLKMGGATAGSLGGLLAMTSGGERQLSKVAQMYPNQVGMVGFHGSPHDFDAFKLDKIGTGEGAQAYGHGLYFAESPTVAKTYQGKVSAMLESGTSTIDGRPIDWDNPREAAAFELARHNGDREAAAKFYEQTFKKSSVPDILRSGEKLPQVDLPGRLYTVDIPDSAIEMMLDWDRPLSEQPEGVRSAIERSGILKNEEIAKFLDADPTGQNILYALKKLKEETYFGPDYGKHSSLMLAAAGIPGIKYLDGGSRGSGNGTRNFVVFDETLPKIIKKE